MPLNRVFVTYWLLRRNGGQTIIKKQAMKVISWLVNKEKNLEISALIS